MTGGKAGQSRPAALGIKEHSWQIMDGQRCLIKGGSSAAPIFDSGTSLWFDKPAAMINAQAHLECKPFKNTHAEQIKLVSSFEWLDLNALYGIEEELRELAEGFNVQKEGNERKTKVPEVKVTATKVITAEIADLCTCPDTYHVGYPVVLRNYGAAVGQL